MSTTLVVIVAVALLALIALVVIWLIQRKKAKAAEGGEQGAAAGGDEIGNLIREAEKKLSQARLEKGARIGNLPLFLLLGDSGSAKTSLVLHSGLEPELLAGQVYVDNDVAPTRSANLWFARRTVFVEAGGPLVGDAAKWKQLVKQLRPRQSVMGKGEQAVRAVILCFDCENFARQGAPDAAAASARTLRTRLSEMSQALGINLPVYVLFTRIDRLPFFIEYVRNFSDEEAAQVFGATLPLSREHSEGVYAEEQTARLTAGFDEMFRALASARREFLPRETDESKLPAAYQFPREFRKIRPVLTQFLVDLCRPSQLTVGPLLRGFYFTGVRPVVVTESAPIAAAAAPAQTTYEPPSGATGMFSAGAQMQAPRQTAHAVTSRRVPQWTFVTRLFHDVLLADKAGLGASAASTKTNSGRRILFIAAAALCLIAASFWTLSFFRNRGLASEVSDAAHGIATAPAAGGDLAPIAELTRLETLRVALERLGAYHRTGRPWTYGFGLYIGDDLYPEARRIYFARFQQLLLGPTQAGMLQFLQSLPAKPGPDYNPTYDALKGYLITTSNHDKSTRAYLSPVLMKWWSNQRAVDAPRSSLAQKQFDFYADELREENPFSSENDAGGVARARTYLSQFAGVDRVYAFILAEAGKGNPPINFNRQFPDSARIIVETHEVPGAFTKGGWGFMKDAIPHADRYFSGEEWVLGKQQAGSMDPVALQDEIRKHYYADFLKEWQTYIKSASVQRYTGVPDAAQKLMLTAGAQSPLMALLCVASENTAVDEPALAAPFQPVQAVVPPGCTSKYAGPANQNYMGALLTLQSSLEAIASQPAPDATAAAPTLANAAQAKNASRQMALAFRSDSDLGGAVQKILEDPITNAEGVLRGLGPAELNAKGKGLCTDMRPVFAKYPFNPAGREQATIEDINAVFHPERGSIWQFYAASLAKLVSKHGDSIAGAPIQVNPAFRLFLSKASAFTDAAYQGGAGPRLTYTVKPVIGPDLERIKLAIDGQVFEFVGAASPAHNYVWPGPAQGVELTVRVKGGAEYLYPKYDGVWGVFQLVGDADRRIGTLLEWSFRVGKAGRPLLNPANNQPISVRLDIAANPPIFDKGYFGSLSCVSEIAK